MDTKAVGKGDQFLNGIVSVDVVTLPVGEFFLDDMAAVACGIDYHVGGFCRHRALQHRLQCTKIVVIFGERQIIDKQHEFQGVIRQFIQNLRDDPKLILADLDEPQAITPQLIDHRFDGGGFTFGLSAYLLAQLFLLIGGLNILKMYASYIKSFS